MGVPGKARSHDPDLFPVEISSLSSPRCVEKTRELLHPTTVTTRVPIVLQSLSLSLSYDSSLPSTCHAMVDMQGVPGDDELALPARA